MSTGASPRIAFVGPSLPSQLARRLLGDGELRPPIRRGDLDEIAAGAIVGIVDGLFAQTLAISPGEIREAIERGVTVYGAASMGALRAAEVPAVVGVGRIFEMYRSGAIERDDEVAVVIDPETHAALTEPLVNVRFAAERLVRSGTINDRDGAAIVDACARLHFTERTYQRILRSSALAANRDLDELIALLRRFDLKRDDAHLLLETLAEARPQRSAPRSPSSAQRHRHRVASAHARARLREPVSAPVAVWESGDALAFDDLVRFLKITGGFERFARNALGRMATAAAPMTPAPHDAPFSDRDAATRAAQALLDRTRLHWGWESPEEAHVTMRDLGLGLDDVADALDAEALVRRIVMAFARAPTGEFTKALRAELWLADLALKRETMRLASLRRFARQGAVAGPPTAAELSDARRCVARLRSVMRWSGVERSMKGLGLSADELDDAVREIALARRAASPLVAAMEHAGRESHDAPRTAAWRALGLALDATPKAPDSARFSLSSDAAASSAETIARQMGIVRIGLVGELDTLGVYIAQAFGERSGWSSSFSSGKALTRSGARVGAIMEEAEIHAQDAYAPTGQVRTAFASADATLALVDPRDLDLPFDSRYDEQVEIDWAPCVDLLGCTQAMVPTACVVNARQPADVLYSPRLGGKIFSSSGLGAGFTLAEAAVHAAAEVIERHALRLAELQLDNPGGVGMRRFWFVDERTLPATPAAIVAQYQRAGMCVRIVDITSEIAVPTFFVRVFDDPLDTSASMSSDGFACHPDPEVAVTMALLEAAQTRGGFIAGGREDYSLQARSLGRHERPRTAVPSSQVFWFSADRPSRPFSKTVGLVSDDLLEELEWIVDRVARAGLPNVLLADLTTQRIRPAHAVRVIIPGVETTNPLYTGPRARATLIRDLLPTRVEPDDAQPETWHPAALAFHHASRQPAFRPGPAPTAPAVAPRGDGPAIDLPRPDRDAGGELAGLLARRRSIRAWAAQPIAAERLSELLWLSARNRGDAGNGCVSRTYPSGGAAYSLELYPVIAPGAVASIAAGVYRYLPADHRLETLSSRDADVESFRSAAALSADCAPPPVLLVITSRFARVSPTYGRLAYGLVLKEVGGLFQTLYLVCERLELAACALGGGSPDALLSRLTRSSALDEPIVGELMLGPRE